MFCPKCKSEFVDGIEKCPECMVGLIEELSPEPEPEFVDYEEILSTNNPADVAFLKSILDSEEITYFFKGENFQNVQPLVDMARLMVRTDQVQMAKDLIKGSKLAYMGINVDRKSANE